MTESPHSYYPFRLRFAKPPYQSSRIQMIRLRWICLIAHLVALAATLVSLVAIHTEYPHTLNYFLPLLIGIVFISTGTALFYNRPLMFRTLRHLMAIESQFSRRRGRFLPEWKQAFLELFPFSILMPPGDLLAVAFLIINIRANTDHLDRRQSAVFDRAEVLLAIGALLPYLSLPLLIATATLQSMTPIHVLSLLMGWHAMMTVSIALPAIALDRMHREIGTLIDCYDSPFQSFLEGMLMGMPTAPPSERNASDEQ